MSKDSITEDIRRIRRELAAKFDYDLDAILADLRKREAGDGRTYISLPARRLSAGSQEPSNAPAPKTQR